MVVAVRWCLGLMVGTLIIAATSPWFVRSYVPRVFDHARGTTVLKPGSEYRWRAEGYATTSIGPHGMMGRTILPSQIETDIDTNTIALWGDSQAEGVSVADDGKLWAVLDGVWKGGVLREHVMPLAASGQDVNDWITQMPVIETSFRIDGHWILLCETSDLVLRDKLGPSEPIPGGELTWLPDFVLHAGRNLLIDSTSGERRKFRFGIGPIDSIEPVGDVATAKPDYETAIARLRQSTSKPITIVYAPRVPYVMGGVLYTNDPMDADASMIRSIAERFEIDWIDCRPAFSNAVAQGVFPHGFANGRIGNGHLNAVGYRLIANAVQEAMTPEGMGPDGMGPEE